MAGAPAPTVTLRDVRPEDLPTLFAHQRDPEATRMAAFPTRDEDAFAAHWTRILADPDTVVRTVLVDGEVAGNVVSWATEGGREVGYWIGREHWGRGVATQALAALLVEVATRPLRAGVARHNVASRRVLEKCGFRVVGEEPPAASGDGVAFTLLELR